MPVILPIDLRPLGVVTTNAELVAAFIVRPPVERAESSTLTESVEPSE